MSKLLVTGAAGFIGANFVHYWNKKHSADTVIALDNLSYAGNKESLLALDVNANFLFIQEDIINDKEIEKILREYDIDTIVHFAAQSHVDRSIHTPDIFLETNIMGTHSLLKAARQVWLIENQRKDVRFHHISTDEVYGTLERNAKPFTEEHPYKPNSPYAASKAASDHIVRSYFETYDLPITISNCSNNYGPFQFPEKLIPLVLLNILNDKELPIYGDGKQIRDWLYVEDHCRAIEQILLTDHLGECFNIGGNNEWENINLVEHICSLMDNVFENNQNLQEKYPLATSAHKKQSKNLIKYVTDRLGHDRRYAIDATKSNNVLGFYPQETFESGIKKTVLWYLENEKWWTNILDGSYKQWIANHYK